MAENLLALAVRPLDVATPLLQARQLQRMQTETAKADFEMRQNEMGAEFRGLAPFVNSPEFGQRWTEAMDRMAQRGILDPQRHSQLRGSPSPLLLQQGLALTTSPELAFRRDESLRAQRNSDRAFSFQETESRRAQSNADRAFALQKEQADAAARGFDYREIDDGAGGKTLIRINKATSQTERVPISGMDQSSGNPFGGAKMTEVQGKAGGFADRMLQAEQVFQSTAKKDGTDTTVEMVGTDLAQQGMAKTPVFGNYLVSGTYQKFDQAKRNFINAQLRRESGAVISPEEFANANKQYFPMPGDNAETLAQKRENRRAVIEAMGRESGSSYRPKLMFDETGRIVQFGNKPQQQPKTTTQKRTPSAQAIELLKRDNRLSEQFDEYYGAGAAARALGVR